MRPKLAAPVVRGRIAVKQRGRVTDGPCLYIRHCACADLAGWIAQRPRNSHPRTRNPCPSLSAEGPAVTPGTRGLNATEATLATKGQDKWPSVALVATREHSAYAVCRVAFVLETAHLGSS